MSKNPYNLILGKEPLQVISRAAQMAEILESFSEELASQQIYMITGIKGYVYGVLNHLLIYTSQFTTVTAVLRYVMELFAFSP